MEVIFRALSHPIRRQLLDLLRQRDGRTLTELDTHLPMTRFGTMKHLRILEAAGIVATRRVGREKLHFLNPVPIRLIHDRWISKYAEPWAGALSELRQLEVPAMNRPKHVYEIYVRSTPEAIWDALTQGERTRDYFYGTLVASEWKPGVPLAYAYPDGRLAAEGQVLEVDRPRRLVHTFSALWDDDVKADPPHRVEWRIEPMGATCRVTCEHSDFAGENATYRSVSGGLSVILNSLKTLLETGAPLAIGG